MHYSTVARRYQWSLATAGYVLIALILTWPVIEHLTTYVAGTGGDPWQSLWRLSTTATTAGQNWSVDFLGRGLPRLVNLSAWPWVWLVWLLPVPAAYNIIWLLSYILAGLSMFGLCRYLLRHSSAPVLASWVAGLMYMLLPYHVAQSLGHFGAMQIQWLPLIIWIFLAWCERPRWWKSLILSALLIVQAWTEHHYIVWLGLAWVWYLIWQYWQTRTWRLSAPHLRQTALILTLIVVGVVMPYWPTVRQALQANNSLALGEDQTIRFSADALAYVVPASFHTLWGRLVSPLYDSGFTGNVAESTHFLGLVPLLLVIFFRQSIPRDQRRLWGGLAILFFIISLGPRLHILGWVTPIRLPWVILQHIPVFDSIRAVARASIMVALSISVLVAWVLSAQIKRWRIYSVLAALIILEFISVPIPMESAILNPAYTTVKDLPGQTLIEIPAATNYVAASRALYASTIDGKEVLGSIALERAASADDLEALKLLPGLRQLLYLRTTDIRQNRLEFFGQNLQETLPDVLRFQKVSAILLHTDSLSILQLTSVQRFLQFLQVPQINYGDVILYNISALKIHGDGIFLRRGDGWANVGFDAKTDHTLMQLPKVADVHVFNLNTTTVPVTIKLTIKSDPVRFPQIAFDNQTVSATTNQATIQVTLPVSPGEHVVTFTNPDSGPLVIQDPTMITPTSQP